VADVLFIAGVLAFFGVAAAYVRACDRIIGRDQTAATPDATPEEPRPRAGSAR
jgi:hypothetical protein